MTHRDHLNLPEPRLITFTLRILLHNSTAIRTWHLEFLGRLLDEHVADKGVCLDVPILDVARDESAAERCFELFRCGVAVLRPVGVVDLCDDHAFFSPVFVLVVLSHVAYQHFKRVAGHDPHHRAAYPIPHESLPPHACPATPSMPWNVHASGPPVIFTTGAGPELLLMFGKLGATFRPDVKSFFNLRHACECWGLLPLLAEGCCCVIPPDLVFAHTPPCPY